MSSKSGRKKSRLLILTLDPYNKGGILSMMSFVYKQAEKAGFDPWLVYNKIPSLRNSNENATFLELLKGYKLKITEEKFEGMKGIAIDRGLPEIEFFNYIFNLRLWKKVIKDSKYLFSIGGSNNAALPLAFLNKNFIVWVATPLIEDRIDRIKKQQNIFRKIRDYLSLPVLYFLEKYVFKKAKKIFSLSEYTKKKIIAAHKIDSSKIEIAHFPINTKKFSPNSGKEKGNYIIFTGRIDDERKNISLLLKAFGAINKEYPDINLKLIGGKPNNRILDLIDELDIKEKVDVISEVPRDDLINYYQNARVFVLPSYQEGLCISALEALSCGIPVISTKCGGPEDYIINGYNGFLVENGNLEDMIDKLKYFLSLSKEKENEMRINARNYILKNFSNEKDIWNKFEQEINKL